MKEKIFDVSNEGEGGAFTMEGLEMSFNKEQKSNSWKNNSQKFVTRG